MSHELQKMLADLRRKYQHATYGGTIRPLDIARWVEHAETISVVLDDLRAQLAKVTEERDLYHRALFPPDHPHGTEGTGPAPGECEWSEDGEHHVLLDNGTCVDCDEPAPADTKTEGERNE